VSSTISLSPHDEPFPASGAPTTAGPWWRNAVVYQVYPRSFADGNGDGIGDLTGIRARLPYLSKLGVDALWINPWYPSPMADGGYDVADYRDIEPDFGTLAEAEALIAEAHTLGIRIIIDLVPNHCSDVHPWFIEALAAAPGSVARERFHFLEGKGANGELPPNDWQSRFGGPAWTRTVNADGTPGQWYLHLYAPEQPDLNWDNPEIRTEFEGVLHFWFDRGVDGIRIDVADGLIKEPGLPDGEGFDPAKGVPYSDRDGVHDIYRAWRAIADSYDGDRVFVGEMWIPDPERFAMYLRPDELHTAFNFDFLSCPWDKATMRSSIDTTMRLNGPIGAPATWVLSNHDVTRHVTRYGKEDTSFSFADRRHGAPNDAALGMRRARAAALLTMALPGSVYVYQGEELGLDEIEDLDDSLRQDPVWERSEHRDPGRDGCRIPLPWSTEPTSLGFSPADATAAPWLPQPARWAAVSAEVQETDPASMLALYRAVIKLRKAQPGLLTDDLDWIDCGDDCLSFTRGPQFGFVLNLGAEPAELPAHETLLLTSSPLTEDGRLPADTAAWLRLTPASD
jgi:alpha-glucosidase